TPFTDLDSWQGPWIRPAWLKGIVKGYNNNLFRPNRNITRAEAVKVVLATFGYEPLSVSDSFFNDVSGWSTGWIEKAHQMGVVQGIGNGNFDPNRAVTRAEAAKIIVKTLEYWDTHIN
ncbi:MAG TPA: S-layer homology domain-containing protein, partial [Candidatus Gracilibacteria bacterium]|nr:S-layer homology domain-containing protein [Candidatus Gracilibacteria bacterium]